MMQRSEALILDFDGTIIDTEWPIFMATNAIYEEYGLAPIALEMWQETIGIADHEQEHDFLGRVIDQVRNVTREQLRAECLVHRDRLMAAEAIRPGIAEWIDAASTAGITIGVASSSTPEWVNGNLERLDLSRFMKVVAATGEGQRGKPAPDVYLRACAGLGVDPSLALAIEDSPPGLQSALAAGMGCITVPNRITTALTFDGSVEHVHSLADLDPAQWLAID
ncbi:MAG: HAD family phosphatase [Actinobacteria bacterium]|nr:HAD family phosphatase [Actinomycetota bacterium]